MALISQESFDNIKSFAEWYTANERCKLFPECGKLLRLVLVLPATNAVSERSFSALRRVKTFLRSSMTQQRLNHLMVLHVHKELTDLLDPQIVIRQFVMGHHDRAIRIAVNI